MRLEVDAHELTRNPEYADTLAGIIYAFRSRHFGNLPPDIILNLHRPDISTATEERSRSEVEQCMQEYAAMEARMREETEPEPPREQGERYRYRHYQFPDVVGEERTPPASMKEATMPDIFQRHPALEHYIPSHVREINEGLAIVRDLQLLPKTEIPEDPTDVVQMEEFFRKAQQILSQREVASADGYTIDLSILAARRKLEGVTAAVHVAALKERARRGDESARKSLQQQEQLEKRVGNLDGLFRGIQPDNGKASNA